MCKRIECVMMKNQLTQIKFFEDVSPDTLEYLWKKGKVEVYNKGVLLMRAKEPVNSVYMQLSGKSIIYNLTHTGKRKIIFTKLCKIIFSFHLFYLSFLFKFFYFFISSIILLYHFSKLCL